MNVIEICRKVVECEEAIDRAKTTKEELEKEISVLNDMIPQYQEELRNYLSILSSGVYTDIDNIDDNSVV